MRVDILDVGALGSQDEKKPVATATASLDLSGWRQGTAHEDTLHLAPGSQVLWQPSMSCKVNIRRMVLQQLAASIQTICFDTPFVWFTFLELPSQADDEAGPTARLSVGYTVVRMEGAQDEQNPTDAWTAKSSSAGRRALRLDVGSDPMDQWAIVPTTSLQRSVAAASQHLKRNAVRLPAYRRQSCLHSCGHDTSSVRHGP